MSRPFYYRGIYYLNDLNEGYYDVFFPGRNLMTTIETFQGVQNQGLLIENNSNWNDFVTLQTFFMSK